VRGVATGSVARVLRVYRIPYSTNVERVALACGHKGVAVDWIDVPADDRSAVVEVSGQPLVPVLVEDDGTVLADSPAILRRLEELYPEPPLWPTEPSRRAELDCFVDWFNGVWKRPPNLMADELQSENPDRGRLDAWGGELAAALERFEALLDARSFLFGNVLTAVDVVAFPFLKYAALPDDPADTDVFHTVLREWQPLDGKPRLRAWIDRVDASPRA
jgi:glutathione S-transferase